MKDRLLRGPVLLVVCLAILLAANAAEEAAAPKADEARPSQVRGEGKQQPARRADDTARRERRWAEQFFYGGFSF